MGAAIQGLGVAVPPHTMTVEQAIEIGTRICATNDADARRLGFMFQKSGVAQRHISLPYETAYEWVSNSAEFLTKSGQPRGPTTAERLQLYGRHALGIALAASTDSMSDAGIDADEITHLVTVSCTGFESPGVDLQLIQQLGLKRTVQRIHVGFMGCHGAINGLRAAQAISLADPNANVLLCAVELCCLHFCMTWDPQKMVSNALFGDGAAAAIINQRSIAGPRELVATGSCIIPDSEEAMTWRVGDHGFEMTLEPEVPQLIDGHLKAWLSEWLATFQLNIRDVRQWCVHPGGPRILRAVEKSLALPEDAMKCSRHVLANYGNMSSPTVLFILQEQLRQSEEGPIVMLGFGPGLIAEAALLQ